MTDGGRVHLHLSVLKQLYQINTKTLIVLGTMHLSKGAWLVLSSCIISPEILFFMILPLLPVHVINIHGQLYIPKSIDITKMQNCPVFLCSITQFNSLKSLPYLWPNMKDQFVIHHCWEIQKDFTTNEINVWQSGNECNIHKSIKCINNINIQREA